MASTGLTFYTSVTTDGGSGTAWNNPQNAETEALTTNCPLGTGPDSSEHLYGVQPGFAAAIPSSATIDGIEVQVRGTVVSGGASSVNITAVRLTKTGADNAGDNKATGSITTTTATRTFGGATDLWNTTWTPAEINAATFGLRFRVQNTDPVNSATVAMVWLKIIVYYTPSDVGVTAAITSGASTVAAEVDTQREVTVAITSGPSLVQAAIGEPGVIVGITSGASTISADADVLVQATATITSGSATVAANVSQPGITPARPENVKAVRSVDFETVTLTWDAVTDALSYNVLQADGRRASFAIVESPSSASQVVSSLDATISYNWKVQAISTTGHPGPYSQVVFTKGENTDL